MAELFEKGRSTITEHLKKYLKMVNWMRIQYVGISGTLLNTVLSKEKSKKQAGNEHEKKWGFRDSTNWFY